MQEGLSVEKTNTKSWNFEDIKNGIHVNLNYFLFLTRNYICFLITIINIREK